MLTKIFKSDQQTGLSNSICYRLNAMLCSCINAFLGDGFSLDFPLRNCWGSFCFNFLSISSPKVKIWREITCCFYFCFDCLFWLYPIFTIDSCFFITWEGNIFWKIWQRFLHGRCWRFHQICKKGCHCLDLCCYIHCNGWSCFSHN